MATALNGANFPIATRDAFLIPSGQNGNHLFFVLTDPSKNDSILMVNATSCHGGVPHDGSCYLGVGDHPFFNHQSYVLYSGARIVTKQRLRSAIAAGDVIFRPPPVTHAVFTRITNGVSSTHMDPIKKAFFQAHR